jgi:hypothetical protein
MAQPYTLELVDVRDEYDQGTNRFDLIPWSGTEEEWLVYYYKQLVAFCYEEWWRPEINTSLVALLTRFALNVDDLTFLRAHNIFTDERDPEVVTWCTSVINRLSPSWPDVPCFVRASFCSLKEGTHCPTFESPAQPPDAGLFSSALSPCPTRVRFLLGRGPGA